MPILNLQVPTKVSGVDSKLLNPRACWQNLAEFEATALDLATQFNNNFEKFEVSDTIREAGPNS